MSTEPLIPDLADLQRPPRSTVRLARSASVFAVAAFGIAIVLEVPSVAGRATVVALTAVAVTVVTRVTAPRAGGRAPADTPWVRATIAAAIVVTAFGVLTFDVGLVPRATVLLFGVIAVTAAFVLPSPHREVVASAAVLAWVSVLALEGTAGLAALATHAAGGGLLAVAAGRSARVAETAIADRSAAAAAAGQRTVLVAAVLRMGSLEPDSVTRSLLYAARQLGFRDPAFHLAPASGPPDGTAGSPASRTLAGVADTTACAVAGEVHSTGRRVRRPHPDGRSHTVGVPVVDEGTLLGALTLTAPDRSEPRYPVAARWEALDLLVEEAGRALARAHRYATDAATVGELRRLEALTQDVVSTVSHELRTPVTVIAGLGQTLARRWDDLPAARRADLLRRVDANADRLSTMVRSLLDSSALESGELTAHAEPLDLRALVDDVVSRMASVTGPRPVQVEVPPATGVVADPGLLRHALENLLGNAAQHTPPGTTVTVTARRVGDEVRIEVSDDGPGIAAEDLPHVLERFYRAGPSRVARPGGLGLGLALVDQIVALHGRELAISSGQDEGATFSFGLPAAAPELSVTSW